MGSKNFDVIRKKSFGFFVIKRYYTIDIVSNRKIKPLNIKAYLPTLETEFKTVKLKLLEIGVFEKQLAMKYTIVLV